MARESVMVRPSHFINPSTEARNAALVARTREITRESTVILEESPRPHTFIGRKTQEPFPQEKKD
jgi:hypothetical protein